MEVEGAPQQGRRAEDGEGGVAEPEEPRRGVERVAQDAAGLERAPEANVDQDQGRGRGQQRLQWRQRPPFRDAAPAAEGQGTGGQHDVESHEHGHPSGGTQAGHPGQSPPGVRRQGEGSPGDSAHPRCGPQRGGIEPAQPTP